MYQRWNLFFKRTLSFTKFLLTELHSNLWLHYIDTAELILFFIFLDHTEFFQQLHTKPELEVFHMSCTKCH